ncbi:MAG: glycosyltransferase [Ferruginibacter sp.]
MKYSILLPVKNGDVYIKECVRSILSQTYTDFNFIVLDNCSTDGTLQWIESIEDQRIKIIPASSPLSIEENWGRIVTVEKNEFITIIGHDDILNADFLQTIDEMVQLYPEASLYHTHFNLIDAKGNLIRKSKAMNSLYSGSEFLQAFLTSSIDSMGTGYVMRSKDYDNIGGIPKKYPNLLFADFELWTELANKSFAAISLKNCFSFRVHQSATGTSADEKIQKAFFIFGDYLAALKARDQKMAEIIGKYGGIFLLHYCKAYAHRMLRTPLKKRQGVTVKSLVEKTKELSYKLGASSTYHPEKKSSLQLAMRIDNNFILRNLFLLFKKIYSKPIL